MQQKQNNASSGKGSNNPSPGKIGGDVKGQRVENQPFDLAVEVNDSEEIESDEDEDEVNVGAAPQQQ